MLARRPDASALLFWRGRALMAVGRTEEAAGDFGRAIAAMPEPRPEHVIARRDALLSLGRREEALSALDEGMARVGRVVSLQLPAVDLEVELRRYEAALNRLDELLARGARNPAWVARRGDILERAGRTAEAHAEYERALAIINTGSKSRHVKAFDDLKRRLEAELASVSTGGQGK
jgi:tetratricopeptide (TPR) repeat protein